MQNKANTLLKALASGQTLVSEDNSFKIWIEDGELKASPPTLTFDLLNEHIWVTPAAQVNPAAVVMESMAQLITGAGDPERQFTKEDVAAFVAVARALVELTSQKGLPIPLVLGCSIPRDLFSQVFEQELPDEEFVMLTLSNLEKHFEPNGVTAFNAAITQALNPAEEEEGDPVANSEPA